MTVIKIKNSAVSGKLPAAGDLNTAELALNLADRKLYSKDASGNVFELGASGEVPSGGTGDRPASPNVGDLFYDTDTDQLLYWDGSTWEEVGGGSEVLVSDSAPTAADYEEGTLWWNSDESSAILYVLYDDPTEGKRWVEASPMAAAPDVPGYPDIDDGNGATLDARYVKATGDNMTGDLTLGIGTDKITLDATDGGATFAERVESDTGFTAGGNPNGGTENGTRLDNTGVIKVSRNTAANVFEGYTTGNSTPTATVNANGSASFAGGDVVITGSGNVKVGDPDNSVGSVLSPAGQNYARYDGAGSSVFAYSVLNGGTTDAETVARINYDGSASFKGNVDTGTIDISSNSGTGCEVRLDGLVRAQRPTGSSGSAVFQAWNGNLNSATITAGGSATFAGTIQSTTYPTTGYQLESTGSLGLNAPAGTAGNMLALAVDGTQVTTFTGTGNATFAGNMNCGGSLVVSNSVFVGADTDNNRIAVSPHSSGSAALYIGNARISTSTFYEIWTEPDNDANYVTTTDVDEDGNTVENRVYNGPTLDVKESIQTAQAARDAMRETFQELQVAVENAADFSSLKAAMLVALEDYAA